MTLHKDQDPGWWRRGMSKRGTIGVVAVCAIVLIGALTFALASGIALF